MVKIALAGASGNVAQEILDALVYTDKHEIVLLSRKDLPTHQHAKGVSCRRVDYNHQDGLIQALQGVHTLLCFITPQSDPRNSAQKALIDAAIRAGVKRYAPSEWASSSLEHMPWYSGKAEIRQHLRNINQDKEILEYCLFQPGMFVNYFASPHKTSKHVHPFKNQFDFENRQAIMIDGGNDAVISLITVQDFCSVVVRAVEYQGKWPVIGGIRGDDVTAGQLIEIGEDIRGPFAIEKVREQDLKAGVVNTTWLPLPDHPAIPADQVESLAASMTAGMLLAISAEAMRVSDQWNRLLPEHEFTTARAFLTSAWQGKP